jgi:hypothetical protein
MPLLAEQEDFHCDTTVLTGISERFSRQLQFDPLVSKVVEQIRVDLVHAAEREEASANQNYDQEAKGQAQLCPDMVSHHVSPHGWLRRIYPSYIEEGRLLPAGRAIWCADAPIRRAS